MQQLPQIFPNPTITPRRWPGCPERITYECEGYAVAKGFDRDNLRKIALSQAADLVVNALRNYVDAIRCPPPCTRKPNVSNMSESDSLVVFKRVWYTLWIGSECTAFYWTSIDVECKMPEEQ